MAKPVPYLASFVACAALAVAGSAGAAQPAAAAKPAVKVNPKITLHVKDSPLRDVLQQISAQTGLGFTAARASATSAITLDADELPFWAVMREICVQAGLGISNLADPTTSRDSITLDRNAPLAGRPFSIDQGFLLSAVSISQTQTLTLAGQGKTAKQMQLNLSLFAPPGLEIQRYAVMPAEIVDDRGHSLLAQPPGATPEWLTGATINISLGERPSDATRIDHMTGTIHYMVMQRADPLVVADPLKVDNLVRDVSGGVNATLTIESLRKTDTGYELRMNWVRTGAANPGGATESRPFESVHLTDAAGHEWRAGNLTQSARNGKSTVTRGFTAPRIAANDPAPITEPARLTIDLSATATELKAKFELKDLALP